MSVLEGEARVAVKEALPALGLLCAFVFAWGLLQLLDRFCRALFGTAEGLVGWIPFAGRVVKHSIHKIEQKVSNYIGSAEREIDAHIATSFHKLAMIVRSIPSMILDEAALLFGLAAALVVLPSVALVKYLIRVATAPIRAAEHELEAAVSRLRHGYLRLSHFVTRNVWKRLLGLAAIVGGIIAHDIPGLRRREHAIEQELSKLWKWVRHRRIALTTGAFIGAFVWALGKLGIGYVRCANVKKVGRALCRAPSPLIDALIAALLAEIVLANFRELVEFAQASQEEVSHEVARMLGLELPRGRFTIE